MTDMTHDHASFRSMIDGTQEDWDIIAREQKEFAPQNGKRILDHLKLLGGDYGGFPVDRLEHCLQTATRAHRDGRDEEYVVMALLHDIGDTLGAFNHPDVAAAILKRGCGFVQVPTTLLAQVDSSVGGKTGINARAGKNLVGAFHQPKMVLIDPDVLDTLPPRQLRAGYAEVVKYGLIDDADFFAWCEANGAKLLAGDAAARTHAIAYSVAAKARIVGDDEFETSGRRALLNLGHTFGHALEAEAGFSDRLLHGEAVAAGCALAFGFSAAQGLCDAADAARVAAHWRESGLPDGLTAAGIDAPASRLVEHMRHDKKASAGRIPFLLARGIGQTYLDRDVDLRAVEAFLGAAG